VKFLMLPLCAWFATTVVSAQPVSPVITARSFSGQFMAREMRGRPRWSFSPSATRVAMAGSTAFLLTGPPPSPSAATDEIPLEPALLVVSCERVKELFLMELGLRDEWSGKVNLIINRSLRENEEPSLAAIHGRDGWSYELELPKTIRPQILVRAVIQTLLAELANRGAASQSAEIPFWLVDGISAHLQAFNLPTFILRPNVQSAGYQKLTIEGMEEVRTVLRQHAPLTFQQLSWPEKSDVAGTDEAVYRSCAQLLFESLMHLDDGQACLRRMFEEMPKHLNWQTAFLLAFHSHFARMLDVEKWWGLNCVSFTTADLTAPRTAQECWHKLQDALDVPVEVQIAPARNPAPARLTLQEVILQWDAAAAQTALQRAVRELEGLQWFTYRCDLNFDASDASPAAARNARDMEALQVDITQQFNPLVTHYLGVLLSYIKQSEAGGLPVTEGKFHRSSLPLLKEETVRQLNDLDQQREVLRAKLLSAAGGPKFSALATGTGNAPAKKARPPP
jgi:hypothetical protein